jgi:hypothetical protein
VITDKSRSVYTYGYDTSKETYIQRMARVNEEYNGIFEFAKAQRQYWKEKIDDNKGNRICKN